MTYFSFLYRLQRIFHSRSTSDLTFAPGSNFLLRILLQWERNTYIETCLLYMNQLYVYLLCCQSIFYIAACLHSRCISFSKNNLLYLYELLLNYCSFMRGSGWFSQLGCGGVNILCGFILKFQFFFGRRGGGCQTSRFSQDPRMSLHHWPNGIMSQSHNVVSPMSYSRPSITKMLYFFQAVQCWDI